MSSTNIPDSLNNTLDNGSSNNSIECYKVEFLPFTSQGGDEICHLSSNQSSVHVDVGELSENIVFESFDDSSAIEEIIILNEEIDTYDPFKQEDSQNKNMGDQIEEFSQQCFSCGEYLNNETTFKRHFKFHYLSKPFQETEVGYECKRTKKNCKAYFSSITDRHSILCPICDFSVPNKLSFIKHVASSHLDKEPFKCLLCEKLLKSKLSLASHLLEHSQNKDLSCIKCNFCCKNRDLLIDHYSQIHAVKLPGGSHNNESKGKRLAPPHSDGQLHHCEICNFQTRSQNYIRQHFLRHSSFRPFHCSFCIEQCIDKQSLKDHFITYHTDERPFSCLKCEKSFKKFGALYRHRLIHSQHKPFKCSYCSFVCKRKDNLKSHLVTHFQDFPFKCDECNYASKYKGGLKQHLLVHTSERPYSCQICLARFKSRADLNRHCFIHSGEKPFECDDCLFRCRNMGDLRSHVVKHSESKPFQCDKCTCSFKRKSSLQRHYCTHSDHKILICNFCNIPFKNKLLLRKHLLLHNSGIKNNCRKFTLVTSGDRVLNPCQSTNTDNAQEVSNFLPFKANFNELTQNFSLEKFSLDAWTETNDLAIIHIDQTFSEAPDICTIKNIDEFDNEIAELTIWLDPNSFSENPTITHISQQMDCDTRYMKKIDFKRHYPLHFLKKKACCSECSFECHTKRELKEHFALQHKEVKPYKCLVCGQGFRLRSNLKQHAVIHSDDKPFQCYLCDYKCKLRETLKRHFVVHSNERPFKCNLCNFRCKLKEKLKRHSLVHSINRPFQCEKCEYSCKSKDLLKKHAIVHTRGKDNQIKS